MTAAQAAPRRPSRLRWVGIVLVAGIFGGFLVLITGLPGFGYRRARRAGDFRNAADDVAPLAGVSPEAAPGTEISERVSTGRASRNVTLYYPLRSAPWRLVPRPVLLEDVGDERRLVEAVVRGLTEAPEGEGLLAALPRETRALTLFRDGELLTLNLSPDVQEHRPGGMASSVAALRALVNSLTSLPGIRRVRLLVSNQEALTFRDHLALGDPLGPDAAPAEASSPAPLSSPGP